MGPTRVAPVRDRPAPPRRSLLVVGFLVVHIAHRVLDGFAGIALLAAVVPGATPTGRSGSGSAPGVRPAARPGGHQPGAAAPRATAPGAPSTGWRTCRGRSRSSTDSVPAPTPRRGGFSDSSDLHRAVLIALVRVARESALTPGRRTTGFGVTIAVCLGIALFALAGPLQPHWAKRAGTPAALLGAGLGTTVRTATVRAAGSTAAGAQSVPFAANLQGTLKRTNRPGGQVLDFLLTVSGGAHGELRIRLAGKPVGGGGVSMADAGGPRCRRPADRSRGACRRPRRRQPRGPRAVVVRNARPAHRPRDGAGRPDQRAAPGRSGGRLMSASRARGCPPRPPRTASRACSRASTGPGRR